MRELDALGPRLRAARRARRLTLDELARRAGVSASTISRLESGKRQANLELLLPLARQLGISIDTLVTPVDTDPRVRRPATRRGGMVIAPLTAENSPMQTAKVTYPPNAPEPTPQVHDGYEWLYVLSGRLLVTLGESRTEVSPGEAAEFDTRIPHSMRALGDRPCEIISIFSDNGMRVHRYDEPAD